MDLRNIVLKGPLPNAAGHITGARFILQSVGGIGPPSGEPLQAIGTVDAVCPYCHAALKKKPGSKTKCRACGNFIYVRTRPLDNQRISVTEDQIELVAEQWAIRNGTYAEFLAARRTRDDERVRLVQELGREPSKDELNLSLLNNDIVDYAAAGKWGFYRCTRLEMGDILGDASNWEAALLIYLEVAYLDVNDPNNLGDASDAHREKLLEGLSNLPPDVQETMRRATLPFQADETHTGIVAPAIVDYIADTADEIDLDLQRTESLFFPMAEQVHKKLGLPISPSVAWAKIKAELEKIETESSE
jgi:hypothetical protein